MHFSRTWKIVRLTAVLAAFWCAVVASRTTGAATAGVDLSGEWSGSIVTSASYSPIPLFFRLKQSASGVTGSGGPSNQTLYPLEHVQLDGRRLTCELSASETHHFRFDLTIDGNELSGQVSVRDGDHSWTGRAVLSRER